MNEQSNGQQQPNRETIISIQRAEIDRINDNRVYLMARLEETVTEANTEIARLSAEVGRLLGVVSQLKGMLGEDVIEEAEAIISG